MALFQDWFVLLPMKVSRRCLYQHHENDQETFREILLNAQQALGRGERHTARRWAERAVQLDPNSEDAWLTLAAIASPRASINYLQQALKINPDSQRGPKGMQWALERLPSQPPEGPVSSSLESTAGSSLESPASHRWKPRWLARVPN